MFQTNEQIKKWLEYACDSMRYHVPYFNTRLNAPSNKHRNILTLKLWNSVSSFQLPLLLRSGDVHPNPGPPSGIVSSESRKDGPDLRGLRTFYANARSIVNKVNLLELAMYQRNYDLIVLTETHLDHSILDSEIFPSHYTVFEKIVRLMAAMAVVYSLRYVITLLFLFVQLIRATLKCFLLMCSYLTTDG